MTLRSEPWPAGVPCWADIQVPDVAAAQAFYAATLGWTYTESTASSGGYVIAQVDGASVAGIGPTMGGPSAWVLYLASDDADKTAAAVTENGGTVLLAPGDVGASGRLAIATDPTGAVFGIWQAGGHIGSEHVNAPGGITWEDLRTPDADAARAFYAAVFGYTYDAVPGAPDEYTTFALPGDEGPRGGMGGMFGSDGSPPHWLIYFAVADAAGAIAAAEHAGGRAVGDGFETPYGRMAGLTDPNGALFWVNETLGH